MLYNFQVVIRRLRCILPTATERSIDWIDLSPSLTEGSSPGLLWHCWLLWPRPPTDTLLISSNRPTSMHCSRALSPPIGQSAAHTRLRLAECCHPPVRVVSFVFLFFPFSPCFTHTAERKGSQSERKNEPNPSSEHTAALAADGSLFYTGFDN